jgi:hypothetical protein
MLQLQVKIYSQTYYSTTECGIGVVCLIINLEIDFFRFSYSWYWLVSTKHRNVIFEISIIGQLKLKLCTLSRRWLKYNRRYITDLDKEMYFILQWQHLPTNIACPIIFLILVSYKYNIFWYWSVINRTYKCKTGHIGGYCFQIHAQNYFKYFYHRPVNVYLRFKIAG